MAVWEDVATALGWFGAWVELTAARQTSWASRDWISTSLPFCIYNTVNIRIFVSHWVRFENVRLHHLYHRQYRESTDIGRAWGIEGSHPKQDKGRRAGELTPLGAENDVDSHLVRYRDECVVRIVVAVDEGGKRRYATISTWTRLAMVGDFRLCAKTLFGYARLLAPAECQSAFLL
jgi:hypothetical protein